jgi:hypothetical protein
MSSGNVSIVGRPKWEVARPPAMSDVDIEEGIARKI